MKKKISNKNGSIFSNWENDPAYKKDYHKELEEFALSELVLALMEDDQKSVRKLAELAGVSPTAIQDLKSGKAKDVKFKNFISIARACGYALELVKGKKRISIH